MGLEGSAGSVGPCQGSKPEMSEGARRNGMGSPAPLSPLKPGFTRAPQLRDRASFPTGTRSPQEAPLLHALHVGHPPSRPGQLMPSAAGPQGPSSLIHTILISVFSSYGEEKKIYLCCLAPCSGRQRQTFALPVCSLSSNSAVGPAGPRHACHCSDAAGFRRR